MQRHPPRNMPKFVKQDLCSICAQNWVAAKEFNSSENPRFPFQGSFKGDIDTDIEGYHDMDT